MSDTKIAWMRSSRCSNGNCVEVARDEDAVLVRDSKDPDGPELSFTPEEWRTFAAGVRDGEFGGAPSSREGLQPGLSAPLTGP